VDLPIRNLVEELRDATCDRTHTNSHLAVSFMAFVGKMHEYINCFSILKQYRAKAYRNLNSSSVSY
jgi:hypothetical protein